MFARTRSISRSISLLAVVSVLCIAAVGGAVALVMGYEMRSEIKMAQRVADGKSATLGIESHFNMVSRIARNIMLGIARRRILRVTKAASRAWRRTLEPFRFEIVASRPGDPAYANLAGVATLRFAPPEHFDCQHNLNVEIL